MAGGHWLPGTLQNGWQTPPTQVRPAAQSVVAAQMPPEVTAPAEVQTAFVVVVKSHFCPAGQPHCGSVWHAAPVGGLHEPLELPELLPLGLPELLPPLVLPELLPLGLPELLPEWPLPAPPSPAGRSPIPTIEAHPNKNAAPKAATLPALALAFIEPHVP